jgi:hypothetical protein
VATEHLPWTTPLEIAENGNSEEDREVELHARTQKELLDLHNALIKEAKLQGLAKYQVRLPVSDIAPLDGRYEH